MNHLKSFAIAAIAAMALTALATSSASAAALYSGNVRLSSGAAFDFSLKSESSAKFTAAGGEIIAECPTSTLKGKLSTASTGSIETWSFTTCTMPIATVALGKLEVTGGASTQGTVKSDAEIGVTISTVLFGSCAYGVGSGVSLGSLSGNPATFSVNAALTKLSGSSFTCPLSAYLTATYVSTEPKELHVEES